MWVELVWLVSRRSHQSPKGFLESYQDMLLYTQREDTWPLTKMELEGRGVSVSLWGVPAPFRMSPLFAALSLSSCVGVFHSVYRWCA